MFRQFLVFIVVLSCACVCVFSHPVQRSGKEIDIADAKLSVPQLIEKYGYPVEEHYVTTKDGYILCLHRIPHGRNLKASGGGGVAKKRQPFFIQHGILSSSADFVLTGPERALGYVLANAGYDVWMGNHRGNHYSRNHTTLNPDKDKAFWDFSWHEMGTVDLPLMVDYVLNTTGFEQMFHVGHSQGTTTFYVMTSTFPEYNKKIKAHFSLAPISYMKHMFSPLMKALAFFDGPLEILLKLIGVYEFMPNDGFLESISEKMCMDNHITQPLCKNVLFLIGGFNSKQLDASLIPVIAGHTPAGSSTKQLLHFAQLAKSLVSIFKQYDYGLIGNIKRYKNALPPSYALNKITCPVYLLHGANDWLSSKTDVNKLYKKLGNAQGKFLIGDEHFNHLDFMYAKDSVPLVYNKVLGLAAKYD